MLLPRAASAETPRRPNVVLIVADDLGFQLGCYGDKVARTPSLDALATEGTRFNRAYCTTASCSASRSVLMTGLYNHAIGHYGHAHGYNHFSTYESVRSLPVLLADAGYRTCHIGKSHLAPEYVYRFDAYRHEGSQGHRNTVRMAENAKAWIKEASDKPFFLYFCPTDPHRGGGPDRFANFPDDADHYPGVKPVRYRPADVPVPPWLPDNDDVRAELAAFYQAIARLDQGIGVLLSALKETGHADDTLVIFLSDNGPPFPGAKTTLYEPGARLPLIVRQPSQKKRGMATDARVTWADITPTILDYCGVAPPPAPPVVPRENEGRPAAAQAIGGRKPPDGVAPPKPTAKSKAKLQPYRFHGRSFRPAVEQEHAREFDEVFLSHTFHEITMYYPMRAVVRGRYKYIFNVAHQLPYPFASDLFESPTWQGVLKRGDRYYGRRLTHDYLQRPRHELYDLEADPDELENLADKPEHAKLLAELQARLRDWQKRTADPWELKWRYE
jgi:N-sulfoglucosamine sulfohydrolase